MRLLWGKNSVSFVIWQAASFSNNGHNMSSKTQNERWMGFRIHSQTYPGNPLKFGGKSPGNPWKRMSFLCWPPGSSIIYHLQMQAFYLCWTT